MATEAQKAADKANAHGFAPAKSKRALNLQGEAFLEMAEKGESGLPNSLSLLLRYYTSADRAFH